MRDRGTTNDALREPVAGSDCGAIPVMSSRAAAADHLRWNYIALLLDGGFFMGALAFVNATTLLPTMVRSMGGPGWLVSFMPAAGLTGFFLLPIFSAHYVEGLRRYKPFVVTIGVGQRLPYLLAGLILLLAADKKPLVIVALAAAPVLSGLMGGLSMTAWQQLVMRCVPTNRRSSLFAHRYLMSCLIGIGAGFVVEIILERFPAAIAYGIMHLAAFAGLTMSLVVFASVRESTPLAEPPASLSGLAENLLIMPRLLRSNRQFSLFIISRFFRCGMFILMPYLAIHFRLMLGRPLDYLGQLLAVHMAGAIVGNLLAAWGGDRFGSKLNVLLGSGLFVILAGWAMVATTSVECMSIFFLFGVSFFLSDVGVNTLSLEISPARNRSSFLAMTLLVNMPGMLLAAYLANKLWNAGGSFAPTCIASIIAMVFSVLCLLPVRDPRVAVEEPIEVEL